MKRITGTIALAALLTLTVALPAAAQHNQARVRVVHASPDAPAVDVLVNDGVAFSNAAFKGITDYAALDANNYNVKVVPTGASEPVVIDADLSLMSGTDYTVVAVGQLADIEPLVLEDNNSKPAEGKAHVRFVHASPDAPAVDIAVTDGPVLFSDVAFKDVGDYLPVDAGTYDLEARIAGTSDVALSVPGVELAAGTVYSVFAVGLAGGEPALSVALSADAVMPAAMPKTGGGGMAQQDSGTNLPLTLLALIGIVLISSGLAMRSRPATQAVERD